MSRHRPFVAAWVYSANSWFRAELVRTASRDLRFSALTGNNHHVLNIPSHPSNYNAVAVKLFSFLQNGVRYNMKQNIGCDVHEFSIPASRCSVEVHHTLPSARYTVPLHFACVRPRSSSAWKQQDYIFLLTVSSLLNQPQIFTAIVPEFQSSSLSVTLFKHSHCKVIIVYVVGFRSR